MNNQTTPQHSQHQGWKISLVVLIVLVLLAGAAYAGFNFLYQAGPNDELEVATPVTNTITNTAPAVVNTTINTNTETNTNADTTDEESVTFILPDPTEEELINGLIPKSGEWLLTHAESAQENLFGDDCAATGYNFGSGSGLIMFSADGNLAVMNMDGQALVFYGGTSNNTYVYVTDYLTFPVQTDYGTADGIAQLEMQAQTEEEITGYIRWDNRVGCEGEYPMNLTLQAALPSELIQITYGTWDLTFPDYDADTAGNQHISFLENNLVSSIDLTTLPDFITGQCTLSGSEDGITCETPTTTITLSPIGDNTFASSDATWITNDGISITGHFTVVATSPTEMVGYFTGTATTPSGLEVEFGVPFSFTLVA